MAAVAVLALTLSGCSGSSSSSSTAATGGSPATVGQGDVVALAQAFAGTLSDEQRTALNQQYGFANAQNWSNLPNALLGGGGGPGGASNSTGRVGLQTSSLSEAQWTSLKALLASATGSAKNEGYDEAVQHLAADDYLGTNGGGDDYGAGNYFVAFLGTPSATGTWELQFGGHHLAVANTYVNGQLAGATPSFRGIEPMSTVTSDTISVQPEQQEQAAFAALLTSLDTQQATTAGLSQSFNDIVLGPGKDWAFPTTSEGLVASQLDPDQKATLLAAIRTYVGDVADADAARILATYESELDRTYVAYTGNTALNAVGDYIRIDGPSVWIEFSMQNGMVLEGAHRHAVWRDKKTDYAGLRS